MRRQLAVLPGDGVGPEVTREAVKVLATVSACTGRSLEFREAPCGGAAVEAWGDPLPEFVLELCRQSDAVLLGAVGGPRWDGLPLRLRPEQGLLRLRRHLGVFANLRPVRLHPALVPVSPLRRPTGDIDLVICRELTGGLYYGEPRERTTGEDGTITARDTMTYNNHEIARIARVALALAAGRRRRLTSVDKANVLECSRLWREVVQEEAAAFPQVQVGHLYVDDAAARLVHSPHHFDVILTENTFGDILSDLGAVLAGSMGLLPSASLGPARGGLYEPVHGSAPDIAGEGIANPIGAILSAALLLEHALGLKEEAGLVEAAVAKTLAQGYRTKDLAAGGERGLSTAEMGDAVVRAVVQLSEEGDVKHAHLP
ncbi:MAG TPA: 3-isopropylmalate dehydrogenase [Clostridiales bacterium UBA8153]|nr:3-isopropylmalate dehydrogenase [Clostridiales bacterium UBA8153]